MEELRIIHQVDILVEGRPVLDLGKIVGKDATHADRRPPGRVHVCEIVKVLSADGSSFLEARGMVRGVVDGCLNLRDKPGVADEEAAGHDASASRLVDDSAGDFSGGDPAVCDYWDGERGDGLRDARVVHAWGGLVISGSAVDSNRCRASLLQAQAEGEVVLQCGCWPEADLCSDRDIHRLDEG